MAKELQAFQDAILIRNVLARALQAEEDKEAMDFPNSEALKTYLHEHPNADPKAHKVDPREYARQRAQHAPAKKTKAPFVGLPTLHANETE